jgi:hypothetical protein
MKGGVQRNGLQKCGHGESGGKKNGTRGLEVHEIQLNTGSYMVGEYKEITIILPKV